MSVTNYQSSMCNISEERRSHRYINICRGKVKLKHSRLNGDHEIILFRQTSDEDFKMFVFFLNKAKSQININPLLDEAQTALFKHPVRTAL